MVCGKDKLLTPLAFSSFPNLLQLLSIQLSAVLGTRGSRVFTCPVDWVCETVATSVRHGHPVTGISL